MVEAHNEGLDVVLGDEVPQGKNAILSTAKGDDTVVGILPPVSVEERLQVLSPGPPIYLLYPELLRAADIAYPFSVKSYNIVGLG